MTEIDKTPDQLKAALARQDQLAALFSTAYPSQETMKEINLDPEIRQDLEFKQSPNAFLVKHIPTGIYESWSTYNGPKGLKKAIMTWVEEIKQKFPQI